jgi:Lrp/AsnC family transcriptional regulator, leucine-responsive regulatory protein
MDELDLFIVKKLMKNARLSYSDLAHETDLTITAVHKRVQKLLENGTIKGFIARPNIATLKGIMVGVWGTSKARSIDDVCARLGDHDGISFVAMLSGKFLYILASLRDISELQNYSSFVAKTSEIENPTLGIINIPYQAEPESLKSIDYKILKALNHDARKSVADIAAEVGLSAKTVTKALERMMEKNLAEFTILWAPTSENDFITVFYIYLQDNSNIPATYRHLMEKYGKNVSYILVYSNIPNFVTMHCWAKSSGEMQKIQRELQTEGFKDISPYILLGGKYYDCWLDKMLNKKITG